MLERGGGRPGRTALLLRHDAPLIAATLAVLKAGGTAVVLSSRDPAARLGQIRAELEPELLLVDAPHRRLAADAGFAPEQLIEVPPRPAGGTGPAPGLAAGADDVAFIIFTSGSTGSPRGVLQTHRNLIHNALLRLAGGLGLRPEDRTALVASPSGGQGLATVWSTLLNGSTLCPFPVMERGVTGLADWLGEHEVSVFTASATLFRHFARTLNGNRLETIRLLRLGSEPALREDLEAVRRHFDPRCEFANTFSTSETGNITQWRLAPGADLDGGGPPLGLPAADIDVWLLDDQGDPVSPGEEGQIVVRGGFLSPGYWRDEALTAERFGVSGSARLFHTGDIGRMGDDGLLHWTARRDDQVKVRGNRVDLSEVEAALLSRPEVAAAAVSARPGPRGDLSLTGYVTGSEGEPVDAERLRVALRERLPDHAVPTAFVSLDHLPLTTHGKVDRHELALIEPPEVGPAEAAEPVTETEELVAGIWARAFELDAVDRDRSFFELGGDSLLAAVIAAGVHTAFRVELDLGSFVERPTVAAQAELIDRARIEEDRVPPLVRVTRSGPLPLSFAQERTWPTAKDPVAGAAYTMARAIEVRGPLDVPALRRAIEHLFRRHEILRAGFTELEDGRPVHVIQPPGAINLPLIDLSGEPDPRAAAVELLEREGRKPFDPRRPPLVRLMLARLADDLHQVLRLNHHIISDGWSWDVFIDELGELYLADLRDEPPPVSDQAELGFVDYAAWERSSGVAENRLEEDAEWWRRELAENPGSIPLRCARRRRKEDAKPSEGAVWWGLRPEVSAALSDLTQRTGATFLMSRLALFAAQLALESGQYDVVLGTYVTGRRRAETHGMFGFFSNFAILRLPFERELSFEDWLLRVRDKVIAVSAHCDTPHDLLRERLAADGFHLPDIGTIFSVSNYRTRRFGDIEVASIGRVTEIMPWGFTWSVDRLREGSHCLITCDARIYEPRAVRSLTERVERLGAAVCERPDVPIGTHQPWRERVSAQIRRRGPSR